MNGIPKAKTALIIVLAVLLVFLAAQLISATTAACPIGWSYDEDSNLCKDPTNPTNTQNPTCGSEEIADTSNGLTQAFCKPKPEPTPITLPAPEPKTGAVFFEPVPGTYHYNNGDRATVTFEKEVYIRADTSGTFEDSLQQAKAELKKLQMHWTLYKIIGTKRALITKESYPLYRFFGIFPGRSAYSFKGDSYSKYQLSILVERKGQVKPVSEASWIINFGKIISGVPPSQQVQTHSKTTEPTTTQTSTTQSQTQRSGSSSSSRTTQDYQDITSDYGNCFSCENEDLKKSGITINKLVAGCYMMGFEDEDEAAKSFEKESGGKYNLKYLIDNPDKPFAKCNIECTLPEPDGRKFLSFAGKWYFDGDGCAEDTLKSCKKVTNQTIIDLCEGREPATTEPVPEDKRNSRFKEAVRLKEKGKATSDFDNKMDYFFKSWDILVEIEK